MALHLERVQAAEVGDLLEESVVFSTSQTAVALASRLGHNDSWISKGRKALEPPSRPGRNLIQRDGTALYIGIPGRQGSKPGGGPLSAEPVSSTILPIWRVDSISRGGRPPGEREVAGSPGDVAGLQQWQTG